MGVGCANLIVSRARTWSAVPASVESPGCVPWSQEAALARLAALPRRAEADRAGLAALSFRAVQGARDRGASPRARDRAPPGRTSGPSARRSSAPGGRRPSAGARALDLVLRHAGDARALAPPARGAPLDLPEPATGPSSRRQPCLAATSSPSRPSPCGGSTCSSSSSFKAAASTSPAAPRIRAAPGSLSKRATSADRRPSARHAAFLIHDHDAEFTAAFDEIFRVEGAEVVRTPIGAPRANAIAERFVGTVRRECVDWLLISGRPHLERVLRVFVDHDNGHRPHRALGLAAPDPGQPALRPVTSTLTDPTFDAGTGWAA